MAFNYGFSTYNSNQFLTDTHIYIYIHHRNSFLNWSQKWHVNDRKKITICYKYRYFFWQFFFTDLFRPSTQNTNILYCKHIFLHKKKQIFFPHFIQKTVFSFFAIFSCWFLFDRFITKSYFIQIPKKYKKNETFIFTYYCYNVL